MKVAQIMSGYEFCNLESKLEKDVCQFIDCSSKCKTDFKRNGNDHICSAVLLIYS